MSDYIQMSKLVQRERETEEWLRSKDWGEIVMRIHELEDEVQKLQWQIEILQEGE
jgi:hypothetical protein